MAARQAFSHESLGESSTTTSGTLDIRGVDLTSAARLLPRQVTPSEIADPSETELRSFSPKDIADIVAAVLAS